MTVDRSQQEKRDFIRMKIDTPLRAQIVGEGIAAEGLCHELSGGGMQLATNHYLAPGTEVEVTIMSDHSPSNHSTSKDSGSNLSTQDHGTADHGSSDRGRSPALRAKARVVRTQTDSGTNRVGLEILEILH